MCRIDRYINLTLQAQYEDASLDAAGEIGVHIEYLFADMGTCHPVVGYVEFG